MYYVYILECSDGTYYTGWTTDVPRRVAVHQNGEGAKYTRGRLPVKLAYYEECASKSEAQQREYAIKNMTRLNKLKLIAAFSLLS